MGTQPPVFSLVDHSSSVSTSSDKMSDTFPEIKSKESLVAKYVTEPLWEKLGKMETKTSQFSLTISTVVFMPGTGTRTRTFLKCSIPSSKNTTVSPLTLSTPATWMLPRLRATSTPPLQCTPLAFVLADLSMALVCHLALPRTKGLELRS